MNTSLFVSFRIHSVNHFFASIVFFLEKVLVWYYKPLNHYFVLYITKIIEIVKQTIG